MTERSQGAVRAYLSSAPDDGPLTFTVSSQVLNRHGFSLRTDGWMLDNWNANPAVLWMHNPFTPPIGRGRALAKTDRVLAEISFDPSDEFARQVDSKYRRGFLNAVSAGLDFVNADGSPMDFLDFIRMSDEQIRDEAFYDLAEVSAVTVPADPKALVENHRAAASTLSTLSRISRELAGAYDEQEYGRAGAGEVRAVVHAELRRLGLDTSLTAISGHDTATVDTEWDGPAAVAAAPNEAAVLRYMHAWRDPDGDPDEKSTYKFPHHAAGRDTAANLPAVRNGLARLSQADIPDSDRSGVERHLRRHLNAGEQQARPAGHTGNTSIDEAAAQAVLAAFSLKETHA